jgi:hypothetical protein
MIPLTYMAQTTQEVEIRGEKYTLSPLTLSDVGDMMRWFIDLPLQECAEELTKYGTMYDDKMRRRVVAKAKETHDRRKEVINGQDIDDDVVEEVKKEMNRAYSSIDGIARMLWLSIRKTKPESTLAQVRELVDMHSLVAIKEMIDGMMFSPQPEDIAYMDEGEKKTDGVS